MLPPCTENVTEKCTPVVPEEVRVPDRLLQQLIKQVWGDLQSKLNDEAAIKGIVIDPLDIDALLPKPIAVKKDQVKRRHICINVENS